MSHLKERKEKQCLNCNAIIYGRFCQVCGQENVEPKETFFYLVRHFIEDITHFDSKFCDTLKYLLLRPGFLSYEYMRGRRQSYLNPIRMYIFTSAIFFLIYFSVNKKQGFKATEKQFTLTNKSEKKSTVSKGNSNGFEYKVKVQPSVFDTVKTTSKILADSINKTKNSKIKNELLANQNVLKLTEVISKKIGNKSAKNDTVTELKPKENASINNLTTAENDRQEESFWERIFKNKEEIQHKIPQAMFITLPLTALMLQLLYARLKQFFFVNHIIFVINVYIAIYLLLLIQIGLIFLFNKTHFGLFSFLTSLIDIGAVFYTYKSMRNFYLQSRLKTLFKCVLLYLMFGIIITLSFLLVAVIPYSLSH